MILLDKNENRYGPSPACLDALRRVDQETLSAYCRHRNGDAPLERRLSSIHRTDPRRIVIGYGCESILIDEIRRLAAAGGPVLLPEPSWSYYATLVGKLGTAIAHYPVVETPISFVFDVDALIGMNVKPSLVIIPSPNNPTGNSFPHSRIEETLVRFRDVPVILDQAYFGLSDEEDDGYAAFAEAFPNLLILRSFSKLYGLAGVRIGYGIMGDAMVERFATWTPHLGYNRLSELLAVEALNSPGYYGDIRRLMAEDRARICRFFRSLEGFRAYDSDANFVLVRAPAESWAALRHGLTQRGLIVKFFSEPGLSDCLRISLGTREETTILLEACAAIVGMSRAVS